MYYLLILLGFLTSCSMYKRNFECCPIGEGIPCTSVTTLEKMVVESPCGPETFLGCVPKPAEVVNCPSCKCTDGAEFAEPFQRRIWICPKEGRPAYIYFDEEITCEEQ